MKKHKRKIPLFPPMKIAIAALYAAIATVLIFLFVGSENEWIIICGAICVVLIIAYLFCVLAVGHRYFYDDTFIRLLYQSFGYRKIRYADFFCICVSNASYNNGYGYGLDGNIPMQYIIKGKTGTITTVFPFITLHKQGYPMKKVKSGLYSRDLYFIDNEKIFCLGICWFDSFTELLMHTNMHVYFLEDVYLRFELAFDNIIKSIENSAMRCFIISDHIIPYSEYKARL